MNPVRMHDSGPALVASMISRANGGNATPKDFMPYGRTIAETSEPSLEEFVKALGAGVGSGKRG